MYLNPKKYNLNSRALIKQSKPNHIIIVVDRKSRIIIKMECGLMNKNKP